MIRTIHFFLFIFITILIFFLFFVFFVFFVLNIADFLYFLPHGLLDVLFFLLRTGRISNFLARPFSTPLGQLYLAAALCKVKAPRYSVTNTHSFDVYSTQTFFLSNPFPTILSPVFPSPNTQERFISISSFSPRSILCSCMQ